MTRRITLAILMVVWLALWGAGLTTYFTTRSLLIADLDDTIVSRVASLPDVEPPSGPPKPVSLGAEDRVTIFNEETKKPISQVNRVQGDLVAPPQIISAEFTPPTNGTSSRNRTLKLSAYKRRTHPADDFIPLTIVYSAPADHIDTLLRSLTYSLAAFGLAAAAASMLAARVVARVALRPIREAADVIGEIDERTLSRRIATDHLPSELKPVARKLNDMLARLETAFTQRKQFLADASHELRTPVAALVVTLEVALRRQRDIGDYVRALDRCLTDARQLHQLVVALVDQARAERFAGDPDVGPVAISTLLRQCAQMVEPLADTKGIAIHREIPDNLMVVSDEQLLRSMVNNLLANAVEYTPGISHGAPGQISISAELLSPHPDSTVPKFIVRANSEGVKANAKKLVVRVKDNGPGIPPQHQTSIFEPFFRADAARSHPEHHLGLGLALVQGHARALGGSCRVESPPPGETSGSLFILVLPTLEISSELIMPKSLKNRVIMVEKV